MSDPNRNYPYYYQPQNGVQTPQQVTQQPLASYNQAPYYQNAPQSSPVSNVAPVSAPISSFTPAPVFPTSFQPAPLATSTYPQSSPVNAPVSSVPVSSPVQQQPVVQPQQQVPVQQQHQQQQPSQYLAAPTSYSSASPSMTHSSSGSSLSTLPSRSYNLPTIPSALTPSSSSSNLQSLPGRPMPSAYGSDSYGYNQQPATPANPSTDGYTQYSSRPLPSANYMQNQYPEYAAQQQMNMQQQMQQNQLQQMQQPQQYDQYGNPIDTSSSYNRAMSPSQQGNYDSSYYTSPGGSRPSSTSGRRKQDRIDPKQIPRPNEFKSSGNIVKFFTRSGATPPPACSDYIVVDEGNCSPRFVRLTTNNIAFESELIDSTKLCIGAIIQPLANVGVGEELVPLVDLPKGPIRCQKCLAYVNPFFQFVDEGNKFICNLCNTKNDVPDYYRCNLDANGIRRDKNDRAELCRGSVEFTVGSEFIQRPIQDPCYLFVIDVSYGASVTGVVSSAISAVRQSLDALVSQYQTRVRVGIITYDSSIQFYALNIGRAAAEMYVVSDVDEPFVPCPSSEILVPIAEPEYRSLIDATLDMIESCYADKNKVVDNVPCTGSAIQVAADALADVGGKILLVQTGISQIGIGALQSNSINSDKDRSQFTTQIAFYQTLATKCAENCITVDLYVCASSFCDVATMGVLCDKTGGQIFMYPGFNARKDGVALEQDVIHNVSRRTGYDSIMVVRCSTGLKMVEAFGAYYHKNPGQMDLPTIDSDKAFGLRFEHEGKLKDKTEACFQCALLYTNEQGQRRIRVHTISVPVTTAMANIYRYADLDAIINLSLKQAVRQLSENTTCEQAQQALTNACVECLYVYRKYCASSTSAGQLILPEPLKLLPLQTLALIKHPLLQNTLTTDERSFLLSYVTSIPAYVSVAFVTPRLYNLLDMPAHTCYPDPEGRVMLPQTCTLSSESVTSSGIYLLDDSRFLYIWIGSECPDQYLNEIFEMKANASTGAYTHSLYHIQKNEDMGHISSRIHCLIDQLRKSKCHYPTLQIVTRRSTSSTSSLDRETLDENLFFSHLVEDNVVTPNTANSKDGNKNPNLMSYIDFLCWLHKRIQNKFLDA